MRPPVSDVPLPRARKASFEQQPSDPRITTPATFFLSRSPNPDAYSDSDSDDAEVSRDSMYGVQSLDEAVHQATLAASECDTDIPAADSGKLSPNPAFHNNDDRDVSELAQRRAAFKAFELIQLRSDPSSSFSSLQPPPSDPASSRPVTPLNLSNPDDHPSSLPSSPKSLSSHSLKPLDDVSITDEQAIISGEEDNDDREVPDAGTDSMPQLIMPSLSMPSRRPFTERGKAMGRLKVLLAGASGSGKTSLIKSIVQECEHIVHVDPFPPSLSTRRRSSRAQSHSYGMRSAMSEIHASTKPYPSWWSDLEDSRILRRRKSMGDIVLERNLCFVDTPATSSSRTEQTEIIIYYMRQQLGRAIGALDSSNVDFQNMLAGNGGSQVDAIIFLISHDTLDEDVECIRKLCDFTNVIPVIAKSDHMSPDQIAALKSTFQRQTRAAGAKPFLFGHPVPGDTDAFESKMPFAVSSAKSSDDDVMDASTLMSSDYVQPLISSELNLLVQNLFDRDNLAWMRHSASKKLVERQCEQQQPMQSPRIHHASPSLSSTVSILTSPNHSLSSPSFASPALSGSLDYTLARVADHTQREERLAQVHLVKWAADLQRSLQNEREIYAAMARGERAAWLTERLSECVVDGSLIPIAQPPSFGGPLRVSPEKARGNRDQVRNRQDIKYYHMAGLTPHDPLGVVWWTDDLKHRGWKLFQIVGSFGVVGGLALWLANFCGFPSRSLSGLYYPWTGCD